MTEKKKAERLAGHYSRYALGNVLSMAAGFVAFPITTRLLSNEQLGVLGYLEVWTLLAVAVLKLGIGDTLMRFYPHGGDAHALARYSTNLIVVPTFLAVAGWLLCLALVTAGAVLGWIDTPLVAVLAAVTVLTQVILSHLSWIWATRELSGLNAMSQVLSRWATVLLTLLVLLFLWPSATGVFVARIAIGALMLAFGLAWFVRNVPFDLRLRDWSQTLEGLRYGIPLAMKEISNIFLVMINRAMLKWLDGGYAVVGIYTVGFSLAMYIEQLVSVALAQALNPVATRLFATDGAAAVVALKRRVLVPIVYACVGLAAGVVVAGYDFIHLVAGADKMASAPVFVVATVFLLMQPIVSVAGMGLLLEKRSGIVFASTAVVAVLNAALNLIVIPRFGLMGATVSVCASQLALQFALYAFCSPNLRCPPPLGVIARALVFAALFIGVCEATGLFGLQSAALRFGAVVLAFIGLYLVPVLLTDAKLRAMIPRRGRAAA